MNRTVGSHNISNMTKEVVEENNDETCMTPEYKYFAAFGLYMFPVIVVSMVNVFRLFADCCEGNFICRKSFKYLVVFGPYWLPVLFGLFAHVEFRVLDPATCYKADKAWKIYVLVTWFINLVLLRLEAMVTIEEGKSSFEDPTCPRPFRVYLYLNTIVQFPFVMAGLLVSVVYLWPFLICFGCWSRRSNVSHHPTSNISSVSEHVDNSIAGIVSYLSVLDRNGREFTAVKNLVLNSCKFRSQAGRDAQGLMHNGIKIRDIYRIRSKRNDRTANLSRTDNTDTVSLTKNQLPPIVFLLHGTELPNIPGIVKEGFSLEKAKHGLFGQGIYLAENADKADQYADRRSTERRSSMLAMLVVEVRLGKALVSSVRPTETDAYDTLVTDTASTRLRYREFMVRDPANCLPRYLVVYDRVTSTQCNDMDGSSPETECTPSIHAYHEIKQLKFNFTKQAKRGNLSPTELFRTAPENVVIVTRL